MARKNKKGRWTPNGDILKRPNSNRPVPKPGQSAKNVVKYD
jgi:hypothetical protein